MSSALMAGVILHPLSFMPDAAAGAQPGGRAKTRPLHHCYGIHRCPAPCVSLAERPDSTFPLVNDSVMGSSEGAWPRRVGALQIHCKRCIRERC